MGGQEHVVRGTYSGTESIQSEAWHIRVTAKHDKSLARFCTHIRSARRVKGNGTTMTITEDRIKAMDELGFDWDVTNTVEERIEELKAFKAKHGHVRVTAKHDPRLANFCMNMRSALRNGTTMTITEDRIKALDELGFDWGDKNTSFEERIAEMKAFKGKHGHVRVTAKYDKSLSTFCTNIRCARRGQGTGAAINEDRIKALNKLGFEWGHQEIKETPSSILFYRYI